MLSEARKCLNEAAVEFEALLEIGLDDHHSMFTFESPGSKAISSYRRLLGGPFKPFLLGPAEEFEDFVEHLGEAQDCLPGALESNRQKLEQFNLDNFLAKTMELHLPGDTDAPRVEPIKEDFYSQALPDQVYFGLLPRLKDYELPLLIPFGKSKACPPAEVHAAFLKHWQDKGAHILSIGLDSLDIFVTTPPQSQSDCLSIAREHFGYCPGVLELDGITLGAYAETLVGNTIWTFAWDLE